MTERLHLRRPDRPAPDAELVREWRYMPEMLTIWPDQVSCFGPGRYARRVQVRRFVWVERRS